MIILAYSSLDDQSIQTSLGMADYSYYFVMKRFLPLLREFGQVVVLDEPATDEIIANYQGEGQCIYLSFTPPDKVASISLCPAVPVFAWEYSNIPYEEFTHPQDNWVADLLQTGLAITHSSFAADVVRAQLGDDYPVISIPAPLWESCEGVRQARRGERPQGLSGLDLNCTVIDSEGYEFSNTFVRPRTGASGETAAPLVHAWEGEDLDFSFTAQSSGLTMIGFNEPESWGVWSRSGHPWVMLDQAISGDIELEITVRGYAHNIGEPLKLELGTGTAFLLLSDHLESHTLRMRVDQPTNFLAFIGVGKRAVDMDDPRDIGMGLSRIRIRRLDPATESGQALVLDFSLDDLVLDGFHATEQSGRWTTASQATVCLPETVSGNVDVRIELFHILHNDGQVMEFRLGGQCQHVALAQGLGIYEFSLSNVGSTDYLRLDNLGYGPSEHAEDAREMGLGIARISMTERQSPKAKPREIGVGGHHRLWGGLRADNILYTAIFNPNDGRKNWEDIVTAFVYAFRDNPHVTLLVKITNNDLSMFFEDIFTFFTELHPFKCRLVFIHGYLAYEEYEQLLVHSHYIVNASRGEGQCLPLMEFMSSGVPAIAPANTAMLDYAHADNSFVVDSSPEITYWPHDPRQVFRTYWHRIDWQSLCDAFSESERIARKKPRQYRKMSAAAIAAQERYCSMSTARDRFRDFLDGIGEKVEIPE